MSVRTKRDAEGVEKSVYTDPLMWWKNTGSIKYPTLAQIAKRILSIPATSAPSERVFSVAGITIANKRARLLPDTASALIFLHQNWDFGEQSFKRRRLML